MTTQATTQKRKKAGRSEAEWVCKYCEAENRARVLDCRKCGAARIASGTPDDAPSGEATPAAKETSEPTAASHTDALAQDVTTQGALTDEQTRTAWIIGLSLGTAGTALAGLLFGPPIAVLVLAGTAAASVIALFWQSLRTLIGEAPLSAADTFAAFSSGTEEEQKRAVLRGMKDLEYERNVGKISEEDFKRLILRYRTEAKSLLRQIDKRNEGDRAKAETLVLERLRAAGLLDASTGAYREKQATTDETEADTAEADAAETAAEIEATAAEPKTTDTSATDTKASAAGAPDETPEDVQPARAGEEDDASDGAPRTTEAKS